MDSKAPPPPKSDWTPGGATPGAQPRVVWPRLLGITVAIAAQAGLYLGLHQMSTVAMPAWAHRPARPGPLPWPAVVPVDLVEGEGRSATGTVAWPAPSLDPAPIVTVPPPVLRLAPPG